MAVMSSERGHASAICDTEGLRKALEAVGMSADKVNAIMAEVAHSQR